MTEWTPWSPHQTDVFVTGGGIGNGYSEWTEEAYPWPVVMTPLPGPNHSDVRGYMYEHFRLDKLRAETGYGGPLVQANVTRSGPGVLRGLHYQLVNPQGKLLRCINGAVFDVALDIRRSSPSFGKHFSTWLRGEYDQVWIPPGFAHGYLTGEQGATVIYEFTQYHDPGSERAIAWDDPALNIRWPTASEPLLSYKDRTAPLLIKAEVYE